MYAIPQFKKLKKLNFLPLNPIFKKWQNSIMSYPLLKWFRNNQLKNGMFNDSRTTLRKMNQKRICLGWRWGTESLTKAVQLRLDTLFVQMVLSCLGTPTESTTFKEYCHSNLPQTYLSWRKSPRPWKRPVLKQEC